MFHVEHYVGMNIFEKVQNTEQNEGKRTIVESPYTESKEVSDLLNNYNYLEIQRKTMELLKFDCDPKMLDWIAKYSGWFRDHFETYLLINGYTNDPVIPIDTSKVAEDMADRLRSKWVEKYAA